MPDTELVSAIVAGKADFGELVRKYEHQVYQWLYALVKNAADAEELTQCVFVRLFPRLGRFDPERGSFCAWLHSITKNVAMSHFRARRRQPLSLDAMAESEAPSVVGPEELHEARERWSRLSQLVGELDPTERRAMIGFYVRGQSWRDVASELGCTERSARYHALAAVTKLREAF